MGSPRAARSLITLMTSSINKLSEAEVRADHPGNLRSAMVGAEVIEVLSGRHEDQRNILILCATGTHEIGSYLSILAATGITTKKTTPIATWKNLSIQIAGVKCVATMAVNKI